MNKKIQESAFLSADGQVHGPMISTTQKTRTESWNPVLKMESTV